MLTYRIVSPPEKRLENPSFSDHFKLVSSSANYWIVFSVPLIIGACICLLIVLKAYPVKKSMLELLALYVTSGFSLLCFVRFALVKDKFFLWASGMMLVLFVREIHPPGSSGGVYVGLLALLYIAHKNPQIFNAYMRSKTLVTMLGVGFFTYFISVTTDQRWWKFIPGEKVVQSSLEESMELLGHVVIGSALLFAARARSGDEPVLDKD